ncbi:MAG: amidophosphoribosyltransferase [Candidatus Baldrarchaeia archaeon]
MGVHGGAALVISKCMEKCGVIGVYSRNAGDSQCARRIYEGLVALQHRGQESAGIYMFSGDGRIAGIKGSGLVTEVFSAKSLELLKGSVGIGHVRYSTTGTGTTDEIQPFFVREGRFSFALAFNGTITNFAEVRKWLRNQGFYFKTNTDTEVLAKTIAFYLSEEGYDYFAALERTMEALDGAFSVVLINEKGEMLGMRDPRGFKPLCLGATSDPEMYILASESVAIDALHGFLLGDVYPGEIIRISDGVVERKVACKSEKHSHCMFEYVYFAREDSIIEGIHVYNVRWRLGAILSELYPTDADYVIPVPDTGIVPAIGFSQASGIPLAYGLVRNKYVGRTFIMPQQQMREGAVRVKLGVIRSVVSGKRMVVVDDSIVRGTTSKFIVELLKSFNAAKVHLRICCPPIVSPCYMGIDFPSHKELIASKMDVEGVRRFIGADSLGYMTIDGLVRGIGLPKGELCLACLTGEYPLKRPEDVDKLEEIFKRG